MTTSDSNSPERTARWWPAVVILVILIGGELLAWSRFADDRTAQSMSLWITGLAGSAFLLFWWTFFSRTRWKTRILGWITVAVIVLLFKFTIRVDGYSGEVFPILAFKWSPTPEDKALAYQSQKLTAAQDTGISSLDLTVAPDDWPQFRGPERKGVATGFKVTSDWTTHPPRLLWKIPVGLGWSSFSVVGDVAVTQEQRGENETTVCYLVKDGAELWARSHEARFSEPMGGDGPRATPTIQDDKVYALGATGILDCLDLATGDEVWSVNILELAGANNLSWGMAGSPLVIDKRVIVNPGGGEKGLMALNSENGEMAWSSPSAKASYSAPFPATFGESRQVLLFDGTGLSGRALDSGTLLWSYPFTTTTEINAAMPRAIGEDSVLAGSGYTLGSTRLLLTPGTGEEPWTATQIWKSRHLKPKFNDFLVDGDHVYGLDEGILTCLKLEDGQRVWKGGRYGYGQILMLEDQILVLTESGEVVLVEKSTEAHREMGRFQAIDGKTWNNPAIARGRLFVRNHLEAACFDLNSQPLEQAHNR